MISCQEMIFLAASFDSIDPEVKIMGEKQISSCRTYSG